MRWNAGNVILYSSGGGVGGGGDAPPAAPWAAPATGETQGPWTIGDKPWYEVGVTGDDDVAKGTREFLKAKNYRDPAVVAKSLYELNRTSEDFKSKAIMPLADNSTPEEQAAFYKRMGRPDTVDGYKDVKWGDNADPRMVQFGAKLAYDLGIPPAKAEAVIAKQWNEFMASVAADDEKNAAVHIAEETTKLKTAWGDAYETNIAQGKRVMDELRKGDHGLTEDDFKGIEASIGTLPLIKLLGTIGKLTGEGGFIGATGGMDNEVANMTPEQAKAKFDTNMADAEFQKRYRNREDPGQKDAMRLMEQLAQRAGNLLG